MSFVYVVCADKAADVVEPSTTTEYFAPRIVNAPKVARSLSSPANEALSEFFVAKAAQAAVGQLAIPPEGIGNYSLYPERERIVVRDARLGSPLGERADIEAANKVTPLIQGAGSVDRGRGTSGHLGSTHRNGRKQHGKLNAVHGFHESGQGHGPVAAPDTPGVTGRSVMELFAHHGTTECLESVPERVEHDATVFNAAAIGRPQIASKPLGEVAASISQDIGHQVGKEPDVAVRLAGGDIGVETARNELGVQRDEST